jgi:hypothetical protein
MKRISFILDIVNKIIVFIFRVIVKIGGHGSIDG